MPKSWLSPPARLLESQPPVLIQPNWPQAQMRLSVPRRKTTSLAAEPSPALATTICAPQPQDAVHAPELLQFQTWPSKPTEKIWLSPAVMLGNQPLALSQVLPFQIQILLLASRRKTTSLVGLPSPVLVTVISTPQPPLAVQVASR